MSHRIRWATLAILVALTLAPRTSYGWGNGGHMAIAIRAWDAMSPTDRDAALRLIKQHPRYAVDVLANMPEDLTPADRDLWTFAFYATWPDYISQLPMRIIAPAAYHTYPHGAWHIIGLPVTLDPALQASVPPPPPPTGDPYKYPVPDALTFVTAQLCDPKLPPAQRAVALAWVMHLTGDLHEPCHCASLISKRFHAPDGDHVATQLKIVTSPGHTTGLHQFWDSVYCSKQDLPSLKAWDASILADPSLKPESLPQLKDDLTVKSWVQESYELAQHDVYDASVRAAVTAEDADPSKPWVPIQLSEAYKAHARVIGRRVGDLAGLRLAGTLSHVPW
jgi:hypothetical protein